MEEMRVADTPNQNDVNDNIQALLSNGWRHGIRTIGLIEAVEMYATDSQDGVEGGRFVPGSRPPWKGDGHVFLVDLASEARQLHEDASFEVIRNPQPLSLVRRATYDSQTRAVLDRLMMLFPLVSDPLRKRMLKQSRWWVRQALLLLQEERPYIHVRPLVCMYCAPEEIEHKILMVPADFKEPDVMCDGCGRRWSFEESGLLGQYMEAIGL